MHLMLNDMHVMQLNANALGGRYSYAVCDDHFMHMFDINSVQTESFNLGTCDNLKNILIASSLSPEERFKMKETLKKG